MATDPGGQAVEAVDEVDRVDGDQHEQHGQQDALGVRARPLRRRQGQREQLEPEQDHDAGGHDLPGQLGERVEPQRSSTSPSRTMIPARPMSAAISFMSASPMPWVVTDGVPTRMPEATLGGCGS
jgi:hypothetical protein